MARTPQIQNKEFWESSYSNARGFIEYYNRIVELSVSMFAWDLPDTVDPRFLELNLFAKGRAVFFKDDVLGYLALPARLGGRWDIYNKPTDRVAYARNGYQQRLDPENSVIIYNNFLRTNSMNTVEIYAKRLYDIDRAIDTNVKAQKTPILIRTNEKSRLTMKNLYMQYDGNMPFIFADKSLDPNDLSVLQTGAPFVAQDLQQIKTEIYNECLTYLGISNVNFTKRERLIRDEVTRNQGGTIANRYSRLMARKQACEEISRIFGVQCNVEYREDFLTTDDVLDLDGDGITDSLEQIDSRVKARDIDNG